MKTEKACSKCKVVQPMESFHPKKNLTKHPDGRYPQCRACVSVYMKMKYARDPEKQRAKTRAFRIKYPDYHKEHKANNKDAARDAALLRKYGIDLTHYNTLLARQNGKCAICETEPGDKHLAVDHCHTTGKVRGLLCYKCNVSLGHFKDNPHSIVSAIAYVEKHREEPNPCLSDAGCVGTHEQN